MAWATDFGGIRISIHAPRVGCDWTPCKPSWTSTNFNPRTPCGVRPDFLPWIFRIIGISIHAPRVGCDFGATMPPAVLGINFNPRTPCGVRRLALGLQLIGVEFQSTHPVWGATAVHGTPDIAEAISIHAPRVGCDGAPQGFCSRGENFNPRTPCGVRPHSFCPKHSREKFQSTHPVWGATSRWRVWRPNHANFNPRTPCGVRLGNGIKSMVSGIKFQSTHPVWGATHRLAHAQHNRSGISIHAPRVGCDNASYVIANGSFLFQSTHPVWGATSLCHLSTHNSSNFNPRTPCGVRPCQ